MNPDILKAGKRMIAGTCEQGGQRDNAHLDLGRLEGGDGAGEGGSDASHFDVR
jgi:hypothetical protein